MLERGVMGQRVPSPAFLRKLEKPLGIPYEVLMVAAGYTLQTKDEWIYSGTMVLILRGSLGDEVKEFAQRVEMRPSDIEAIERNGVVFETYDAMLKKLFIWDRMLSSGQKELIHRMRSTLHKLPAEKSMTVELLFHALLEMISE
jgi:hypothetical protein